MGRTYPSSFRPCRTWPPWGGWKKSCTLHPGRTGTCYALFYSNFFPVAAILPELKFRYSPGAKTANNDPAQLRTEQQACTHTLGCVQPHMEVQTLTAPHCVSQTHMTPAFPPIVMARLKDNVYMILCNMQQDLQTCMALALESLLQTVYGIACKWGLHTTRDNWCESMLIGTRGAGPCLGKKSVCSCLYGPSTYKVTMNGGTGLLCLPPMRRMLSKYFCPHWPSKVCGMPLICSVWR